MINHWWSRELRHQELRAALLFQCLLRSKPLAENWEGWTPWFMDWQARRSTILYESTESWFCDSSGNDWSAQRFRSTGVWDNDLEELQTDLRCSRRV